MAQLTKALADSKSKHGYSTNNKNPDTNIGVQPDEKKKKAVKLLESSTTKKSSD